MSGISGYKVLVFSSPKCGPCMQLKPNMQRLQEKYGFDMEVIELSDETRPQFDQKGVRTTPTCIGLDTEGNEVGKFVGAQALPILEHHLIKWRVI
ncbi:thioredoxin family protein [Castellaniella sp.]|uniref:thioredoxin family protein n=1 Tax=Castellaniella sp. TaxID=1955812 RepID=UPI002B003228|nr:thioredoxin family protein [Castellaniella sp.]